MTNTLAAPAAVPAPTRASHPTRTDWMVERLAQPAPRGPDDTTPTRAGWHTYNEPELQRFVQIGTVDGVEVTAAFVARHRPRRGELSLATAGDRAIHAARRLTGETFNSVAIRGRRRWHGPMG